MHLTCLILSGPFLCTPSLMLLRGIGHACAAVPISSARCLWLPWQAVSQTVDKMPPRPACFGLLNPAGMWPFCSLPLCRASCTMAIRRYGVQGKLQACIFMSDFLCIRQPHLPRMGLYNTSTGKKFKTFFYQQLIPKKE